MRFYSSGILRVIPKNENLIKKIQKYRKYLGFAQIYMCEVTSFLEKFKNLLIGVHKDKTQAFLLFLTLFILFFNFLRWRFILFFLVIARMYKGKKYYKKTYLHNREITFEVLQRIFHEQEDFKKYPAQPILKIETTSPNYQTIITQIVKQFTVYFDLDITLDLIQKEDNFEKIQTLLSSCHDKLYVLPSKREQAKKIFKNCDNIFKKDSPVKRLLSYIYYFIYNIPSDFYLAENQPKIT